MTNYYNEWDAFAAAWLRELIKDGLIPDGEVDTRSIADVEAADLRGFTQVHFFAGIGGWPLALRLAHWPENRPVWTGSCPCQPYSIVGKRAGADDARNLWPHYRRLIAISKPTVVLGEQVASPDGRKWLSGVRTDLEALGYGVGAVDLSSAGIGAPHIRQRIFFVGERLDESDSSGWTERQFTAALDRHRDSLIAGSAGGEGLADTMRDGARSVARTSASSQETAIEINRSPSRPSTTARLRSLHGEGLDDAASSRLESTREGSEAEARNEARLRGPERGRTDSGLADADGAGREPRRSAIESTEGARASGAGSHIEPGRRGVLGDGLGDAATSGRAQGSTSRSGSINEGHGPANNVGLGDADAAGSQGRSVDAGERPDQWTPWQASVFISCADGKHRRVPATAEGEPEPALFPLAHGIPNRVGTLRGAGNAINPYQAAAFIRACGFLE